MNVIGSASDVGDFLDRNGGDPCLDSFRPDDPSVPLRGRYCPKLKAPTTFYHNVSITQEIADRFEITFGIAHLFNTRPPRAPGDRNGVVQGQRGAVGDDLCGVPDTNKQKKKQ